MPFLIDLRRVECEKVKRYDPSFKRVVALNLASLVKLLQRWIRGIKGLPMAEKLKNEFFSIILGVLITVTLGIAGWSLTRTVDATERISGIESTLNSNEAAHSRIERALERLEDKIDAMRNK